MATRSSGSGGFDQTRRNQLARQRGFSSYAMQRRFGSAVKNQADLVDLPAEAQESRQRALDAIAVARREGVGLDEAARREGIEPQAVRWWAGDDVVSRSKGQWQVSAADRLYRPMYVYSAGRTETVDVRGSRASSTVGGYHAAIGTYLRTGDDTALRKFEGKSVGGVELETDLDVIDELARRGEFDFESIYRDVA